MRDTRVVLTKSYNLNNINNPTNIRRFLTKASLAITSPFITTYELVMQSY